MTPSASSALQKVCLSTRIAFESNFNRINQYELSVSGTCQPIETALDFFRPSLIIPANFRLFSIIRGSFLICTLPMQAERSFKLQFRPATTLFSADKLNG